MKRIISLLLAVALTVAVLATVNVAAEGENLKGVRITGVPGDNFLLTGVWTAPEVISHFLQGENVKIIIYNNAETPCSLQIRTDESWDNAKYGTAKNVPPKAAAELTCGYTSLTNQIGLRAPGSDAAFDLTVCNLPLDVATSLKNAIGNTAQVVDSPVKNCPDEIVPHEGGALYLTNRNNRSAGPSQNLTSKVNALGCGKYYFAGWFRFVDPTPDFALRGVTTEMFFEITKSDGNKAWLSGGSLDVTDTEWHHVGGIINLDFSGSLTKAITYVHSVYADNNRDLDAYAYKEDMIWDGFMMSKCIVDDNGFVTGFGENLFENPECDCDRFGTCTGWGKNQTVTITNTAYDRYACTDNGNGTLRYANGFVPVTDENIRYMGRWIEGSGRVQASFQSNLSLKFTGTSIGLNGSGSVWYDIDYGTPHLIALNGLQTLGENLDDCEHLIRVYAQSQNSRPVITEFMIDENALTVARQEVKKIEFIGDSIIEGYCDAKDADPVFGNNGVMISYAGKVGMRLNEEYGIDFNIVAFGGIGLVRTGDPDALTMPVRYFKEREWQTGDTAQTEVASWDTSKYVPDFVVINLGTNDYTSSNAYINSYKSFISSLKSAYPGVKIILMTPFNRDARAADVRNIVETLSDPNVILVDSALWNIPAGSDNIHPAAATHNTIADKLYDALDSIIFPQINGASLTVNNALTLNYYSHYNGTLIVTHNDKTVEVNGEYDSAAQAYKFAYNGITPQCMNDDVKAELKIDGEIVDTLEDFSVRQYCNKLVAQKASDLGYSEDKFAQMKTLLADMLDYGAAAQKYRHYHSDNLPNTDAWVTSCKSAFAAPTNCRSVSETKNDNYCLYSVGVRLSDVVQLYFRFNVTDWTDVTVDVTRKGQTKTYSPSDITDDALYLDAVYATAFGDEYTVELKHNGTVMQTVTYSVNSYIASKYSGTNSELIHALGRYGASAAAFNAQ